MKVVIIHHKPPYHLDDYLAVSLLLQKYSSDDVTRITARRVDLNNISVSLEEGIISGELVIDGKEVNVSDFDKVIIVDIGRKLIVSQHTKPYFAVYDHHQDINVPSSLVLVLKNEFPELWRKIMKSEKLRKIVEYLDVRDRFGPRRANEILGITDPFNVLKYIPMILMFEPSAEVGKNFISLIESFSKVEENVNVYEIQNLRVAVTDNHPRELPAAVIFDVTGADIVVQPNSRNPNQTSIIKNSESPRYNDIDLTKLKSRYSVTFIHPNGFLAVIAKPVIAIDVNDIIKTLIQ